MDNFTRVTRVSAVPPYIAVVDDEAAVCKAFERLLRAAKFDVETFHSGTAFLSSLSRRTPDCVVLDLNMPGMSGFEVQSHLAADRTIKLAVVIVTARESTESQQRAIEGEASAFLRKPVEAQTLLDAIRAAIAGKAP